MTSDHYVRMVGVRRFVRLLSVLMGGAHCFLFFFLQWADFGISLPAPRADALSATVYLSVLYFKPNAQNRTVNPPLSATLYGHSTWLPLISV